MIPYFILLILVFLLGFVTGKRFIVKGLTLRVEQLRQEGDYQRAAVIQNVITSSKKP